MGVNLKATEKQKNGSLYISSFVDLILLKFCTVIIHTNKYQF